MAVFLSPVGGVAAQFFTNNGVPLSGGKLYSYAAGTTTPQVTYTSASGTTFNTNPIVLDAGGRVPSSGEIWLTDGTSYKFVLKDSNDVLIATWDNITGINSNFLNFNALDEVQTATAGQTIFTLTNSYTPGTNTLQVFVDGVNQYDGSTYAYVETNSTTVTFTSGLHVGALVKFTTAVTLSAGVTSSNLVTYQPAGTGAVLTNVQTKLRENVSVLDFGALTSNTNAQNKIALQLAITAYAAIGAVILVPSSINYGYKVADKTTWPDFTGVTKPITINDYSPGNSYGTYPTTYDGDQFRTFMFTPQTSPTVGLHDGNTQWLRAAWAPNYCISNDADLSGARTADDNRRASYTFFNEGEGTWRIGQGAISGSAYTSEELSNFVIEKYAATGDTLGGWNPMLIERKTGNVGFGLTTNAPGASYVFKSVSTGFYQGVFESLNNTSYLILRTSAGSGEDAGLRNVAGDVSFWVPTQGDALTVNKTNRRVSIGQSLVQKRVSQSYSASMALNTVFANWFTITVTNGTAITMAAPVNVADGQQLTVTFYNTSGGAMGTITWNSAFKLAAWTNPANGYNRSITFAYDGNYWIEISRTPTDIPN